MLLWANLDGCHTARSRTHICRVHHNNSGVSIRCSDKCLWARGAVSIVPGEGGREDPSGGVACEVQAGDSRGSLGCCQGRPKRCIWPTHRCACVECTPPTPSPPGHITPRPSCTYPCPPTVSLSSVLPSPHAMLRTASAHFLSVCASQHHELLLFMERSEAF